MGIDGGFGPVLPVANYQAPNILWNQWFNRLQFPTEGPVAGHTVFSYANDEELRKDPLYLAEVNGMRQVLPPKPPGALPPPNAVQYASTYHGQVSCADPLRTLIPFAKREEDTKSLNCPQDLGHYAVVSYIDAQGKQYCEDPCDYASYQGLVGLFADWTVRNFIHFKQNVNPSFYTMSVEPPDGGQYDQSWKSKHLLRKGPYNLNLNQDSSDSDTTFHLANMVARQAQQQVPGAYVNLYAYFTHALPPSIPIEQNTIVLLAPYAFHFYFSKMLPLELITAWKQKQQSNSQGSFKMGIYDYWASSISVHDIPFMGVEKAVQQLQTFYQNNLMESFTGESTAAAGPLGLTWYVSSHLAWDMNTDVDALKNEFYTLAFGNAAPPMQRMLERWNSINFHLTAHELGLSYLDLQEATQYAANDPVITPRLNDFKKYLHYMRLRFEYDTLPLKDTQGRDNLAKYTKADEMTLYTWRVYDSLMVHAFRDNELLYYFIRDYMPSFFSTYHARWNWKDEDPATPGVQNNAPGFLEAQQRGPIAQAELNTFMLDGQQTYSPLSFSPMAFDEQQLVPLQIPTVTGTITTPIFATTIGKAEFQLYSTGRAIPFTVTVNAPPSAPDIKLKIIDSSGNALQEQWLPSGTTTQFHLTFPPGINHIEITSFSISSGFQFIIPQDVPFVRVGNANFWGLQGKRGYFYVPKGTSRIVLWAETPVLPKLYNPLGQQEIVNAHGPNLFYVDVPISFQGAVWSLSDIPTLNNNFQFLTTPNILAPSPEQLMIPVELQP